MEGSPVVQRPCSGSITQQWYESGGGGAFYSAFANRWSGLDMNVAGASTALGAKLVQYHHVNGAPNALFQTTNTMFQVVD